jgi:BirA family biotin operon repressor/biotin-[acetyl-CoA-carboxylase] ligase
MGAILCKIFDQLVPGKVTLKWPNDVLINSKKVSGILIEIVSSHQNMLDALIGIGVNCNDAPSLVDYPTTALNRHVFPPLLKNELLSLILGECKKNFLLLETQGFEPFQEIWQKFHHQKNITIRQKNHTITGHFKNITPMGLLVIEDDTGNLHTIQTGDLSV